MASNQQSAQATLSDHAASLRSCITRGEEILEFVRGLIPSEEEMNRPFHQREIVRVRCCYGENTNKQDHHCPAQGIAANFKTPKTHFGKVSDFMEKARVKGVKVTPADFIRYFCTEQSGSNHTDKVNEAHLTRQRKSGVENPADLEWYTPTRQSAPCRSRAYTS